MPLPPVCPQCGSRHLIETHVAAQYQIELPAKPIQRKFAVHVGCCEECGQRVQGRHELQTSDALGAAGVQLGANAHAAITWLNKSLGIPHGKKIAKLFKHLFAITINRSTSARSIACTARTPALGAEVARETVRKTTQEKPAAAMHSSTRTLAAVSGVSHATVHRVWQANGLKPHLIKTFKLSNDPQFAEKVIDVVGLYLNPPEHALVLSCDEKSQIQPIGPHTEEPAVVPRPSVVMVWHPLSA